jgi:hypothetical protein
MKNYRYLLVALLGLVISCGPSEEKTEKLKTLVAEWKNTSEKLISLSEKIGDQAFLLESKEEGTNGSQVNEISINGEPSNCEAEYSSMKEEVGNFIDVWRENSLKVDELTNKMAAGNWSVEDGEQLDSLDLQAKEGDLKVEQWLVNLEELRKKCEINPENSNS